jgi:hypothetical protein
MIMNPKDIDILQWTMGWSWPIIAALGGLLAWGIARFLSWQEEDLTGERSSGPKPGERCVCTCE